MNRRRFSLFTLLVVVAPALSASGQVFVDTDLNSLPNAGLASTNFAWEKVT